ncbi:PEP-CTERM sorting domain-containing protein [Thiohalocapsa sp. ML1]|jgi:hypothetical protein|uniref:PEP-CTERM sorting domain-containing protein n=1 Tax=Thiohalocapsa sp. ML1 TaxID=1431688 RepID=UPI000731F39B|nr:PEP-CTERM sorting domain-containing protein [Thiohalocapsa sp. ML1]
MNTMTKFTALGILLAGSLSGMQMAHAFSDPNDTDCYNEVNGTPALFSMWDWFQRGDSGCLVNDKVWTLKSIDNDLTQAVAEGIQVSFNATGPGLLTQQINLSPPVQPFPGTGFFTFDYTGVILDEDKVFTKVDLDVDKPDADTDTSVTKRVYEYDPLGDDAPGDLLATLTSSGGGVDAPLVPNPRAIWVSEEVNVTDADSINSVTNVFEQTRIPEPISTTLIGAGLIGLAALRRRRSTKA